MTHTVASIEVSWQRELRLDSLVRLLGRRYPTLPVLTVGSRTRASASADAGVATL
jgi:hypothetical protein